MLIKSQDEAIFVDTSAFYALLDRDDRYHQQAKPFWADLLDRDVTLMTSNYVVAETVSLLQYRLGFEAASLWYRNILAILNIHWADPSTHRQAYELWAGLHRRRFSIVDCLSYIIMHQHHVDKAFCFKTNYVEQGFTVLPGLDNCLGYQPIRQTTAFDNP